MFKIGSQLFTSAGPEAVRQIAELGTGVFLDLKFHDIPNTVAGAVLASAAMPGVQLVNVHALGGTTMLRAAAQAVSAGVPMGADRTRLLDGAIGRLELAEVMEQRIETLSKGFRRRVGLAQAILHDPPVLVLDEPTDGLDPNQKHEVRELIRSMAPGKTIVISTHILEEVDAVCTRALIIAHGRLIVDDRPEVLEARSRFHNAVTLRLADSVPLAHARQLVEALPEVASVEMDPRDGTLTALPRPGQMPLAAIAELAARSGWTLRELHLESGRLDEVFRAVTRPEAGHG